MQFSSRLRDIRRKIRTVSREEDQVEQRIKSRRGRSVLQEERQIESQINNIQTEFRNDILSSEGIEKLQKFVEWETYLAEQYEELSNAVIRADEYLDTNPSVAESEIKKAERIATQLEQKRTEVRSEMSRDQEKMIKILQRRGELMDAIEDLEAVVQRLETEESVVREQVPDSELEDLLEENRNIDEMRKGLSEIREAQNEFEARIKKVRGRINVGNQLQSLKRKMNSQIKPDVERVKRIIESFREMPENTREMLGDVDKLTHKTRGFVPEEKTLEDLCMINLGNAEETRKDIRMRAETHKRDDMGVQQQVEIRVYVQNRLQEKQNGTLGIILPDGWAVTGMLDADLATPQKAIKRYVLEPGQKQVIKIAAWQYGDEGDSFQMFTTHFPDEPEHTRKCFEKYPLPQLNGNIDYHERIEVMGEGETEMPEEKVALSARGSPNATEPKTYTLEMKAVNNTDEDQQIKLIVDTPEGWRFNGATHMDDASPSTVVRNEVLEPGEKIEPAVSLWKYSLGTDKMQVKMIRKKDNMESIIRKTLP